jgi:H+/Cl- antiporter ClcA
MEYRLLALSLRLLVAAISALLLGLVLWVAGSVTVLPLVPNNAVAVTANLIVGVGVGAGVGGWLVGLRMGSSHLPHWFELPATLACAILCAWFGQAFFDDWLYKNVEAVRVKTTDEVYGAVTGGIIGALILPLIFGYWRVTHRQEP